MCGAQSATMQSVLWQFSFWGGTGAGVTKTLSPVLNDLGMYCTYNSTFSGNQFSAFFDLQYISCVTFYMQCFSVKAIHHCTFAMHQIQLTTCESTNLWKSFSTPLEESRLPNPQMYLVVPWTMVQGTTKESLFRQGYKCWDPVHQAKAYTRLSYHTLLIAQKWTREESWFSRQYNKLRAKNQTYSFLVHG